MFLPSLLLGLMAALVLVQMLLPRQSLAAVGAFGCGGAGLYFAFGLGLWTGLLAVAAVLLIVPLAVYLSLLLLAPYEPQIRADETGTAAMQQTARDDLIGLKGVSQTVVDPAGVAVLNGQPVNVISETGTLLPGTPVVVSKVEGYRVIVQAQG